MGNDQSQAVGDTFHKQDWQLLEGNQNRRLWANRRDPGFTIEQYEIFPENQQQFNYQKDIYYLRKNSNYLVAAFYLQNQEQADFCSSSYRQRLFIEAIPIRLSDIEHIPFPDYLHLYNQTLRGFHQLAKEIGYFSVEEELIGINSKGIVKVWMNEQFEKSFAFGGSTLTEEMMVRSIIELIDKNLLQVQQPNNVPTVINFLYRSLQVLKFEQAIHEFQTFVRQFNEGKVPEKLACIDRVGGVPAIVNRNKNHAKSSTVIRDQNRVSSSNIYNSSQINEYQRPQLIEASLLKNSIFAGSLDKISQQSIHSGYSNSLENSNTRGAMMCSSSVFVERKLDDQLKSRQQIPVERNPHNKFTIIQLLKESNTFNKVGDHSFVYQDSKPSHFVRGNLQNQHAAQSIKTLRQQNSVQAQNFQRQLSATDRVFNPQWTSAQKPQNKSNQMLFQQYSPQPSYQKGQPIRFLSPQPAQQLSPQFNQRIFNSPISRGDVPIIPATFSPSFNVAQTNTQRGFVLQKKVGMLPNQLISPERNIGSPIVNVSTNEVPRKLFIQQQQQQQQHQQPQYKSLKSQEPPVSYNYTGQNISSSPSYNIPSSSYQINQNKEEDISVTFNPKVYGKQTTSSSYNYVATDVNIDDGKSSNDFINKLKIMDSPAPSINAASIKRTFQSKQTGQTPTKSQQFNYESFLPAQKTTYAEPFQYRTLNYQTVSDSNMPTKMNYSLQNDEQFGRNTVSIIAPQLQFGSHVSNRSKRSNGTPLKFERNLEMKYSVLQQDGLQYKSKCQPSGFSHVFDPSRGIYR